MAGQSLSAYQAKLYQFFFGLAFLAVGLYAVKTAVSGSSSVLKFMVLAVGAMSVVLALDRYYWLISAFLFGFSDVVPGLKFTGNELAALLFMSIYFVRTCLRKDTISGKRSLLVLAPIPFLIWMCLVWSKNPTGMWIFGSSAIGGRFYFKVILSFLFLTCLASLKFGEKDCKWLCFAIAAGYVVFVLKNIVYGDSQALIGTSVHYSYNHLSFVVPLFLCRFTPVELLRRFWPLIGVIVTFGLSVYSGNRTSAARPVLVGLLSPFFLRRDRARTLILVLFASFPLAFAVAGHGTLWRLPFSVQRSLSFLPGKWDRRLEDYGFNDTFRATLRMYAREHIAASPWFGDGGFALDTSSMLWANSGSSLRDGYSGHILARNWHNVWLGMSADFGIPLAVAWAFFLTCLVVYGRNGLKSLPPGSWSQTMFLYFYLLILVEILNGFFNGGHSSKTAETFFLWAGWLAAIGNGVRRDASPGGAEPQSGIAVVSCHAMFEDR